MSAIAWATLAASRIATPVFVDLFGFGGSSRGYVQVTVIGRQGDAKKITNSFAVELSYSPTPTLWYLTDERVVRGVDIKPHIFSTCLIAFKKWLSTGIYCINSGSDWL